MCKIVGIGNICMRMFDGQVRTLTNIRHVPNLKKNLLLLGALEARGYKFFGADSGIKVTRCSMMNLKVEQTINLYKLIGSIIISDASTATKKEDTTRLWHMHLGHEPGRSSNSTQK